MIWASLLSITLTLTPLSAQEEKQDDVVYDRVIRNLVNDPRLNANALEVAVVEGIVTIRGLVETEKLRVRADKVVRKTKGVKKVVSQVRVHR